MEQNPYRSPDALATAPRAGKLPKPSWLARLASLTLFCLAAFCGAFASAFWYVLSLPHHQIKERSTMVSLAWLLPLVAIAFVVAGILLRRFSSLRRLKSEWPPKS